MAHGGARKGAGRKVSSLTVRTREIAEKATEGGRLTPLEVILMVMEAALANKDMNQALDAATRAAPYMHPKLSSVEQSGKDGGPMRIVVDTGIRRDRSGD